MSVDILLATYNGAAFLAEQLDSLLAQSYSDWHLLVRDDGSTDGTLAILQDYADRFPDQLTILCDGQRLGAKASFAALMARSTASYVAFCDQDDVWLPHKLARLLEIIRAVEAELPAPAPVLAHCDLELVDEDSRTLAPSFWRFQGIQAERNAVEQLLVENTVTGCAAVFNRALLERALPIPEAAYMHDFWLALIASATGRILVLDEPLVRYRQHGSNTVGAVSLSGPMAVLARAWQTASWKVDYSAGCRQAQALVLRLQGSVPEGRLLKVSRFAELYCYGWLGRRFLLITLGCLPGRWRRRLSLLSRI